MAKWNGTKESIRNKKMQIKQHIIYFILIFLLTLSFFFYMSYREINKSIDYDLGEIKSNQVIDSIYITRDNFSIPTIYSKNINDLFFSFGKVVSIDRLFQLQLLKILLNGEMSRFFGEDKIIIDTKSPRDSIAFNSGHLNSDKFIKNLFLDDIADSLLIYLSAENRARIQNYCNGINSTIKKRKNISSIPFEIKKNIISVEWNIKDVLKLYSLFSILTSIDIEKDLFISKLKSSLPKNQFLYISKQISVHKYPPSSTKREKKKLDKAFYKKVYPIDNISNSFLLKNSDSFYFNSFYKQRFSYPFFSGNELYYSYYSSSNNYPSLFYPINLINQQYYNDKNSFKMNILTIPGLPFPIGALSNNSAILLSPSDSTNYSFKLKEIKSETEFKKRIRNIVIERKKSSDIRIRSFYLDDGFLINPLISSQSDSTNIFIPKEIKYVYFDKLKFYKSANNFISLFFDNIIHSSNHNLYQKKIEEIDIPNLNFLIKYRDSSIVNGFRSTIPYFNNKRMNDSLIRNDLFLSYESSKRFNRLALGNDLIDKLSNDISLKNDSSNNNKSKFVYDKIGNWNRINIKESKGSFFYKNFILELLENTFSDEFSSNDNGYCLNYIKQNINFSFNILFPKNKKMIELANSFWDDKRTLDSTETFEDISHLSLAETDTSYNITVEEETSISFIPNLYSNKFNPILQPLKGKKVIIDGNEFGFKKTKKNILPTFIFKIPNLYDNGARNQFIFAGGISENPLSNFYDDQLSFWKDDIYNDFFDLNKSDELLEKAIDEDNYLLIIPEKR